MEGYVLLIRKVLISVVEWQRTSIFVHYAEGAQTPLPRKSELLSAIAL